MEKIQYNKLVRDKIPEHLDIKGIPYEQRVASSEEFKIELFKKLTEEIQEFMQEKDIEELADVLEVIESIKKLPEYAEVEKIRIKKLEEKGGFEKGFILKGEYNK